MRKKVIKQIVTIALVLAFFIESILCLSELLEPQIVHAGDETIIPHDETGIPDEEFYGFVLRKGDANKDGVLTVGEAAQITSLTLCLQSAPKYYMDITGIRYLTNLEWFHASNQGISDISELKNLKNLRQIYLYNNEITDISGLPEIESLDELYLNGNPIEDFLPLCKYTRIRELGLKDCNLRDISWLPDFGCWRLDLSQNFIEDISRLSEFRNKEEVSFDLSNNLIGDISPLEGYSFDNLDLSYNCIKDISSLDKCKVSGEPKVSHNLIEDESEKTDSTGNCYLEIIENRKQEKELSLGELERPLLRNMFHAFGLKEAITYVSEDYNFTLNWSESNITREDIRWIDVIGYEFAKDAKGNLYLKNAKHIDNVWDSFYQSFAPFDQFYLKVLDGIRKDYDIFLLKITYGDSSSIEGQGYLTRFITFKNRAESTLCYGNLLPAKSEFGDINDDGIVNLTDAQIVLKAALRIVTLSSEQKEVADVDWGTGIDLKDAKWILKFALKITS